MQTLSNATNTLKEVWQYQHPVMHTYLLFSAASLMGMFCVLFFAF